MIPNFNIWQVYHMDNDGQKVILKSRLTYQQAWQYAGKCQSDGYWGVGYEAVKP